MKHLTNAEELFLFAEDALRGGPVLEFDIEERHGVDDHIPGQGVGEVVCAGIVIVLYLVLLQDLLVLLLAVLRLVRPQLEQLNDLRGLDLVDLVS